MSPVCQGAIDILHRYMTLNHSMEFYKNITQIRYNKYGTDLEWSQQFHQVAYKITKV